MLFREAQVFRLSYTRIHQYTHTIHHRIHQESLSVAPKYTHIHPYPRTPPHFFQATSKNGMLLKNGIEFERIKTHHQKRGEPSRTSRRTCAWVISLRSVSNLF